MLKLSVEKSFLKFFVFFQRNRFLVCIYISETKRNLRDSLKNKSRKANFGGKYENQKAFMFTFSCGISMHSIRFLHRNRRA